MLMLQVLCVLGSLIVCMACATQEQIIALYQTLSLSILIKQNETFMLQLLLILCWSLMKRLSSILKSHMMLNNLELFQVLHQLCPLLF